MNNIAYISLGSNIDDRKYYLDKAIEILGKNNGIVIEKVSSIYETDPVGYTNQGNFLNLVIKVKTDLSAEQLLLKCLQTENELGRIRKVRWGPRTVDLDILLYNNENIESENLVIPHPRMHERAFVLIPLIEIAPSIKHPIVNQLLTEILDKISDKEGVQLWK